VDGYTGPHHVTLRQNPVNRGLDHGLELVELAACDVIVMAHADDLSEPQRCRRLLEEMDRHGAYAATSNHLEIDAAGRPAGLHLTTGESRDLPAEEIARKGWLPPLVGSTLAFRRDVITRFPPIDVESFAFGHDTLIPFRGAVLGGMRYVHEPLVRRRRHAGQWGATLHDSSSKEAFRESQAAASTMFQVAMARDLRHLRAALGSGGQPRLAALEQAVTEHLLELSEEWIAARQELYRLGQRPIWAGADAVADARRQGRLRMREAARRLYRRWRWQLLRR